MFGKLRAWLKAEALRPSNGRWARWIGRGWARLSYAVRVEPTWLEINVHAIPITDLPEAFAGFRIVQLSDLHCSRRVTPGYLAQACELAQAEKGDVIVVTGDFIHKGFKHIQEMAEVVGRLSAPHGVFAVLGNHDYSVRNALGMRRYKTLHKAVANALVAQGIRVLRNESVRLMRSDAEFHLAGVEDLWSRECDLEQSFKDIEADKPRVVLAHNPHTVQLLAGQRCDLMLSGHTHGGQVNLPGYGPVALTKKGRQFAAGFYQQGRTLLYVNKGVGFGLQLRFNVRPEVAVFQLERAESKPEQNQLTQST